MARNCKWCQVFRLAGNVPQTRFSTVRSIASFHVLSFIGGEMSQRPQKARLHASWNAAWLILAIVWFQGGAKAMAMPITTITRDDTVITRSCRISIPPGTVIPDTNTNGVIQIGADNITLEFTPGSQLLGAPQATPWDTLTGIGIRLNGHRGITIRKAQVHGFKNGVVVSDASAVTIDGGDFSDNYRQHLRSTPASSDDADWLFPHHNDETKWRDEYGGAVCIENSTVVEVRGIRVRRGQNGILLDRVNKSHFYDNDCSFLSGWGIALWRSSSNIISRNAFDFCIRGHSEGVYNRGCDSAGILCFEQSSHNVFVENSVTHGGDGFFGFAGQEAIGEQWMNAERSRLRAQTGKQDVDDLIKVPTDVVERLSALGCNDNLLIKNDISYASAHGIEMTFSKQNRYIQNRVVENAICGFWGGYSSDSLVAGNLFEGNGGMAYGLERGGINMEHAANNLIVGNQFLNNRCALHFWWNPSPILKYPGISGSPTDVSGNIIWSNHFQINTGHPFGNLPATASLYVLQVRGGKSGHVHDNLYTANTLDLDEPHARELALEDGCAPARSGTTPAWKMPAAKPLGKNHPVGARSKWRGLRQIIMGEWGPWDHESPILRLGGTTQDGQQAWEVFGVEKLTTAEVVSGDVIVRHERTNADGPILVHLTAKTGVTPYRVSLTAPGFAREIAGSIMLARWDVAFFPSTVDPLENLEKWRALAAGMETVHLTMSQLDFPFGMGGPMNLKLSPEMSARGPGSDHFGMIAHTQIPLPVGRWRIVTMSDDGVRVIVNGKTLIENWNIHGGTENETIYEQQSAQPVDITVEYFERDGAAMFKLGIEKN